MLELRRGRDLATEPLGSERHGEIRVQHLERDLPLVLGVARQVYGRHASGPQFTLHRIARSERGLQSFEVRRRHLSGPDMTHLQQVTGCAAASATPRQAPVPQSQHYGFTACSTSPTAFCTFPFASSAFPAFTRESLPTAFPTSCSTSPLALLMSPFSVSRFLHPATPIAAAKPSIDSTLCIVINDSMVDDESCQCNSRSSLSFPLGPRQELLPVWWTPRTSRRHPLWPPKAQFRVESWP